MPLTILPQPGQSLVETRDAIAQNFQNIQDGFAENHVGFGDANAGKHKFVTMPYQSAPTTDVGEVAMYANLGTVYVRAENDGVSVPIGGAGTSLFNTNGYSILTSGLVLQWGKVQTLLVPTAVDFPTEFPNNCLNIQLTHSFDGNNNNNLQVQTPLNKKDFTPLAFTNGTNTPSQIFVYWFAIGY